MSKKKIQIRRLKKEDAELISKTFGRQGWNRPVELYDFYYKEQVEGKRVVLVAFVNEEFAGYLTIQWESDYENFRKKDIPEVNDLNVLIKFREQGIATKLMHVAEDIILEHSHTVGIGFGVTHDYGAGMRLYVKRGYVPDGNGLVQNNRKINIGDTIEVNHDICIYLTKKLGY
ncbi:GNAT family N-acetyltransferase [Haloplasma contractile]|uniref:Acetyltransferase GNAT family protein n=1 Tax=Haloplasma contractile SSD-17B TaxID=1033810 RepID=F7PUF9_9MOLU|nr:GNAT family N-acetyltransferase [Haloplasma contractile]ERJ11768.1 Acetyltransferase GNAT family protein [Haloplasma contractile SSD-17B]